MMVDLGNCLMVTLPPCVTSEWSYGDESVLRWSSFIHAVEKERKKNLENCNCTHMDPIITMWNSEWLSGQVGIISQSSPCVPQACKKGKEKCLSDFWHQIKLPGSECWQQRQTEVFSSGACQFVKRRRSSLLFFYTSVYRGETSARGSLLSPFIGNFLSCFVWCVVGFVYLCWYFFLHHSSSVTLSLLGLGEGMLSVIDSWPVECLVSQIATYWFAARYVFKETHGSSWQISEHLAGPS